MKKCLKKLVATVLAVISVCATTTPVAAEWYTMEGKWYFLDNQHQNKKGWLHDGNKWYLLKDSDGSMRTGWVSFRHYPQDTWYYFNDGGAMVTGWRQVGSKYYYFDKESGKMQYGWFQDKDNGGKWYYLDKKDGHMIKGWLKIRGEWYYFSGSGAMATGTHKIGNKTYKFDQYGHMISNDPVIVKDISLSFDSVGGVDVNFAWQNNTGKTIKYISFYVTPYNRVHDPVRCTIRNYSTTSLKATGPFTNGYQAYSYSLFDEDVIYGETGFAKVWYNFDIEYIKLNKVVVQFVDGSSRTYYPSV